VSIAEEQIQDCASSSILSGNLSYSFNLNYAAHARQPRSSCLLNENHAVTAKPERTWCA